VSTRQVPGNARAADRWSVRSAEAPETFGGCALSGCQQDVALCRVNRAQPTSRASGVSCTPWLAGNGDKGNLLGSQINYRREQYSKAIRVVKAIVAPCAAKALGSGSANSKFHDHSEFAISD